jgi:hypothetical protein
MRIMVAKIKLTNVAKMLAMVLSLSHAEILKH